MAKDRFISLFKIVLNRYNLLANISSKNLIFLRYSAKFNQKLFNVENFDRNMNKLVAG